MTLQAFCYAKVNLFLRVLERRPDGFHGIESIIQTISLHDVLTFVAADSGVEVVCTGPASRQVPGGRENLCFKAASVLFDELDLKGGIRINLEKNVPAAAGLGGGSSDAAGTLMGLNELHLLGLSPDELCGIGARLGSDVPAIILGGTVLAFGRGEQVQRLEGNPPIHFLIAKPDFECPAAAVYQAWDEVGRTGKVEMTSVLTALRHEQVSALRETCLNDLERAAFSLFPQLRKLKSTLLDSGAECAMMCGSGSAVMGIYRNKEERDSAAGRLQIPGCEIFVAESVPQGVALVESPENAA